jgi:membrane-associated phospholipid phosphatase
MLRTIQAWIPRRGPRLAGMALDNRCCSGRSQTAHGGSRTVIHCEQTVTVRPVARVAAIWLPFVATFVLARGAPVKNWEQATNRRLNALPDVLHYPLWVVMQCGTAGAPAVAGGLALAAGRPASAGRLTTYGMSAYLLAKTVKRVVGRGRPGELVPGVVIRGHPASGGGYVSGHAAVAMALAVEAVPLVPRRARPLPILGASVVAVARVYVGAHLPLDALGGAALGSAISATGYELGRRRGPARSLPTDRTGRGRGER